MNRSSLLLSVVLWAFISVAITAQEPRPDGEFEQVIAKITEFGGDPIWHEDEDEPELVGFCVVATRKLTANDAALLNAFPQVKKLIWVGPIDGASGKWLSSIQWSSVELKIVTFGSLEHLKIRNLRSIDCSEGIAAEDATHLVKNHPDLVEVNISGKITDAAMIALCKHPKLARLNAARTGITDAGVSAVGESNLRFLDVSFTKCSGKGFKSIMRCKTLRELDFTECTYETGILAGAANLENLESLTLQSSQLSSADYQALERCKNLRFLDLSSSGVTDEGARSIGKLVQLQSLNMSYCWATDRAVRQLRDLKKLQVLQLEFSQGVTDKSTYVLAGLPSLTHLIISEAKISDIGLGVLAQSKSLQYLGCGGKVTVKYAQKQLFSRRFKGLCITGLQEGDHAKLADYRGYIVGEPLLVEICWKEIIRLEKEHAKP